METREVPELVTRWDEAGRLVLLLADRPVPPAAVDSVAAFLALGNSRQVRGPVLNLNLAASRGPGPRTIMPFSLKRFGGHGTPLRPRSSVIAFARLLEAVENGDLAGLSGALAPGHPGLAMITPDGLREIKGEFMLADARPAAVMATLTKVYPTGDRATLVFHGADGVTVWIMAGDAGGWKLSI